MSAEPRFVRGDLWTIDFGANPADPGQAFRRPGLIVSDDRLHHPNLRMVIVVPGTSTIRPVPLHVVVAPGAGTGLVASTAFQVEQVRAVSVARFVERLGRVNQVDGHAIDQILRNALSL